MASPFRPLFNNRADQADPFVAPPRPGTSDGSDASGSETHPDWSSSQPGGADFTERERLLLTLARPHLVQAYENAKAMSGVAGQLAATKSALDSAGGPVIVLDRDGWVRTVTPPARHLLAKYFAPRELANGLPETMARWLRHQHVLITQLCVPTPLLVEKPDRRLVAGLPLGVLLSPAVACGRQALDCHYP